ncbi:MAG TPA: hypothetical protein VFG59_03930 [Anaeromyxobacter sp.]|nr:hypothetical protein [Anaeromyxobacter sp.]
MPLDTHTVLLYYNKRLLKKAGLLGPDGKPLGLAGLEAFTAALRKLRSDTDQLSFIAFVEKHADVWAGGGHLPAYLPVLSGAALAQLAPVNQYLAQAAQQVSFVPQSPVFGVGGPVYGAVSDLMVPALTGQVAVPDAMAHFRQQVQRLSE